LIAGGWTTRPAGTPGPRIISRTRIDSSYIDLAERISDELPSMIAIVVGLSFVVLLLAFRSLVVPLKVAVANLLSVADASRRRLDRPRRRDPDRQLVPPLIFAILFGLSMDYGVFLLTQTRSPSTPPSSGACWSRR
jgi:RND superfamily putative drug exporter